MRKPLPYSPLKRAITEQLRNEAEAESSIEEEHRLIAALCDRLEDLADSLPELPDSRQLGELATMLRFGLPAHCEAEEAELAKLVRCAADPTGAPSRALELIRAEHAENEAANLELAEMLEDLIGQGAASNPETLGFLLRQVFVLTRRHLAWEGLVLDHVLPEA